MNETTQWAQDLQAWSKDRTGEALTDEQVKAIRYAGFGSQTDMRVLGPFVQLLLSWTTAPNGWYDRMRSDSHAQWAEQISYEIGDNVLAVLVIRRLGIYNGPERPWTYQEMVEALTGEEQNTVDAVRAQAVQRAAEHPDWNRQQIEDAVWAGLIS